MNVDREAEQKKLAEADAHITEAEHAIVEQTAKVDELRAAGHDATTAEPELAAFQETLAVLQDHRAVIIKTIEQIDAGLA